MIDFVVEIRFAPTERSEGIVGALSRSSDRFELQSIKQLTRSNFDVGGSVRSMTHRFYGVRAVCGIQIVSNNIVILHTVFTRNHGVNVMIIYLIVIPGRYRVFCRVRRNAFAFGFWIVFVVVGPHQTQHAIIAVHIRVISGEYPSSRRVRV